MTRLIDADALLINLDEMMAISPTGFIHGETVADMINDAPTVEAVPFEFIQQWISELDDFISRYGGVNKYDSLTEHYIEYTKALNQLMKRWIDHEQN